MKTKFALKLKHKVRTYYANYFNYVHFKIFNTTFYEQY